MSEWIKVSDRMPTHGLPVLAAFRYSNGNSRVIRATYYGPNELELGDQEWWDECTASDDGTAYVAAGWYEDNECEETNWRVGENVEYWQPLPRSPYARESSHE